MDHDQNFKNLILDYPLQALAFFAPEEARDIVEGARVVPIRQEQLKYLDFIDIYAELDDNERDRYERVYPQEAETMTTFADRFRQEGMQQGMQQGVQKGEVQLFLRLLGRKFGEVPEPVRRRIESADAELLLEWSDRLLTASTLDEVIH